MRGLHLALLFKAGTAQVQPVPARGLSRCRNGQRLDLALVRGQLVNAGVIRPLGIHLDAFTLQAAQHAKGFQPGHGQKIHP